MSNIGFGVEFGFNRDFVRWVDLFSVFGVGLEYGVFRGFLRWIIFKIRRRGFFCFIFVLMIVVLMCFCWGRGEGNRLVLFIFLFGFCVYRLLFVFSRLGLVKLGNCIVYTCE